MPNPIKLLVIPSWYPPDGGYFFQEYSKAFAEKGFHVDELVNRITGITTLNKKTLKYLKRFNVSEYEGIRTIRSFYLKLPRLEKINVNRWILSTGRLFDKYVSIYGKPDMIIAHCSIWAGCAAQHIFSKYNIPYIIVENRSLFIGLSEDSEKMFRKFYFPLLKKAFFSATKIVTVSSSLHTKIEAIEPSSSRKFLTISNLVDTGFFKLPEMSRDKEPFNVLSVARLAKVKGLDLLIRAFARFLEKCPDASLRIAGRGPLLKELIELTAELKIKDQVRFVGFLNKEGILREMHQANLLVLASRDEAFGIVLIEAMSTGLPVIATRSGGPVHIVNADAGILTDLENTDQLYAALIKMYEQYERFDQEKIRSNTIERYSKETVMNQYTKLIDEILSD